MRRTLSSKFTFIVIYVLPLLIFAVLLVVSWLAWHIHGKDDNNEQLFKWLVPMFLDPMLIVACVFLMQYRRVQVDEQALYVLGFSREVRIPFVEILDASMKWQQWQTRTNGGGAASPIVQVEFRPPNSSTKQIKFIAAQPWNYSHSIVAEIREWRDRAKAQS
jgi:hypothetical protein